MSITEITQILAGFIGTLCFGILFRIRGWRLGAVSLGGLLSWMILVILNRFIPNEAVNYFIVSFLISIYNEIMARVRKYPAIPYLVTSLLPLIPGAGIYYSAQQAMQGNSAGFVSQSVHTLAIAGVMAVGILLVVSSTRIRNPRRKANRKT